MKHAFTVDLEDWSDGIPISAQAKASAERRLHVGTDRLLEVLSRRNVKATFFILSRLVERSPDLIRRIATQGHEIGSHGLSHDLIYEMTPERFREETKASIGTLEDCVGKSVRSYRAAYFSITRKSLWALDILASLGVRYDSSIFPIDNWRYGIPGYSRRPLIVETEHGPLYEFPLSTQRRFGRTIPTTGGAYFRIYPYALTRANMEASEREGLPVVFYLHPWELDPDHPFVRFKAQAMVTHYVNLRATAPRLEKLLDDFSFTTLGDILDDAFAEPGQQLLQS